jgi:hypothetical protein
MGDQNIPTLESKKVKIKRKVGFLTWHKMRADAKKMRADACMYIMHFCIF